MKKAIRILLAILLVSVVALTVTACSENQDPCAKGHSWDNGQITKPATCAETGTAVYRCKVCGQTEERTLPVTQDHVWDEGKVTTEPTCTQKGVRTYTCTVCKTATRPEDIEATGQHAKGTHVTQVDPTCHSEGTKEYWLCKDNCGTKLNEEGYIVQDSDLVIAPLAHNYDNGVVTTEATCQHEGVKTFTCQNDGCSESYTQKLPKLAHNYDNGVVTTEATYQHDGVKTFTCQNDGCSESFTQTLPKLAHSFGRLVERVEPNCEQAGHIAYYQCAQCKQFFDEDKQPVDEDALVLNALGHTPQQVEGKAPDCTNSGFETYCRCTRCNKLFADMECEKQIDKPVVLPATGHNNRQKIEPIPADCTHGGKTEGWRCADCGATLIEPKNTAPLGHSFIYTSDKDGVHHTVTCARCNYNQTEECTPAQAWQFDGDYHWHKCTVCSGDLTHEPHALQAGSKQCTECGKEVSEIIVQVEGATDHQVANLVEALNYIKQNYATTPATIVLTDDRGATADVTFDGDIDVTLNMSGFGINMGSYRIVVEGNANVTLTNGTLDGKVQFNGGKLVLDGVSGNYQIALKASLHCNDVDITVNGAQLDHTWDKGQVTTPPTCEDTGTRTFTCTRCQATRTEDEPAKGHTYGTLIPKQEPTCTATGTDAHYQCADCHKLFVDENGVKKEVQANELVLDKLAHTYKFDKWTWDEETFKTATAHFSCNVCGHTEQVEVKLIEQDRTPSTCVEQGKVEYRLEKDAIVGGVTAPSQTFTQTLPLAEHVYGEKHPAKQATCSNKGNKEYYQCSECEQYFVEKDGVKVPADWNDIETQIDETNHKYKEEWSFDETNHWYECEYNHEHKTGVTGHEWQYEKSTDKDGYHTKTCKYCKVEAEEEECTPNGGDDKHDDTHGLKKGFYADADHHWQVCQFCEKQFGYEKHSFDKDANDGSCTTCGHKFFEVSIVDDKNNTYFAPTIAEAFDLISKHGDTSKTYTITLTHDRSSTAESTITVPAGYNVTINLANHAVHFEGTLQVDGSLTVTGGTTFEVGTIVYNKDGALVLPQGDYTFKIKGTTCDQADITVGETKGVEHSYKFVSDGNTQHHEQCTVCGNNKSRVAHTRGEVIAYAGNWQHTYKCPDCDEIVTEDCVPELNVCECGHTFTIEEVVEYCNGLSSGNELPGTYRFSGVATRIEHTEKGNHTSWFITVNGEDGYTAEIQCFDTVDGAFNVSDIIVGATITVSGALQKFNGHLEFNKGKLENIQKDSVTITVQDNAETVGAEFKIYADDDNNEFAREQSIQVGEEVKFKIDVTKGKLVSVMVGEQVLVADGQGYYSFTVTGATTIIIELGGINVPSEETYTWKANSSPKTKDGTAWESNNSNHYTDTDIGGVATATLTGSGNNTGAYNGSDWRLYESGNNKITIEPVDGMMIISVTITAKNDYSGKLVNGEKILVFSESGATVTYVLAAQEQTNGVTFTVDGTDSKGKVFITAIEIVFKLTTNHNFGEWIGQTEADCTHDAIVGHYVCTEHDYCKGKFYDAEGKFIPEEERIVTSAIGHSFALPTAHHKRNDSTCQQVGNEEYWECDRCHEKFATDQDTSRDAVVKENIVIDKKAHDFTDQPWKPDGNGNHYQECKTCDPEIAKVAQSDSQPCNQNGYGRSDSNHWRVCSICGYDYDQKIENGTHVYDQPGNLCKCGQAEPHVHIFVDVEGKPADCENAGVTAHVKCTECNMHFDSEEAAATTSGYTEEEATEHYKIPSVGHSYASEFTPIPDTNEHGQQCSKCKQYNPDTRTEHVWEGAITFDPDATDSATSHTVKCLGCSATKQVEHTFEYAQLTVGGEINQDIVDHTHQVTCTACGYVGQQAHFFENYNKDCPCGERVCKEDATIVLTSDSLNLVQQYTDSSSDVLIGGAYFAFIQLSHQNEKRIQARTKDNVHSSLWNTTAIPGIITQIDIEWNSKQGTSSYVRIYLGASAFVEDESGDSVKVNGSTSIKKTTTKITIDASKGYSWFQLVSMSSSTNYIDSITIHYKAGHHVVDKWDYTPDSDDPCTSGGTRTGTCIRCNKTVTEKVAGKGHDVEHAIKHDEEKFCDKEGHIAYYECPTCNKLFSDNGLEHETTLDGVVKTDPVHHKDGKGNWLFDNTKSVTEHQHYCSLCHEDISDLVGLDNLQYEGNGDGSTHTVKCLETGCEYVKYDEPHQAKETYEKSDDQHWLLCESCDEEIKGTRNGHSYNDVTHLCVCGKEDPDFAHKHQFDDVVTAKDPTCTSQGNVEYKQCKDETCHKYFPADALETCGDEGAIDNPFIEPVGHHEFEYEKPVIDSVAGKEGYHHTRCKWYGVEGGCYAYSDDQECNTLGTVSEDGATATTHKVTCTVCNTPHSVEHKLVYNADGNKTEAGHTMWCADCHYSELSDGHDYPTTPTRVDEYQHKSVCTTCEYTNTANHDWGKGEYGSATRHDCSCGEELCKGVSEDVSFSHTDFTNTNNKQPTTVTVGKTIKVTLVFDKGTSNSDGKFDPIYPIHNSAGEVRVYTGNTITFSANGNKIIKVVIKLNDNDYPGTWEVTEGDGVYKENTWTGSATSLTLHNTGAQARIASIIISVEGEPADESHLWDGGQVTKTGSCKDNIKQTTTYTCLRCGATKTVEEDVPHVFEGTPEYDGANGHHIKCQNCDTYSKSTLCENTLEWNITDETHRQYCTVCGHNYVGLEGHSFAYTDNKNNTHHKYCSGCAWEGVDEGHDLDGDTGACKANGCTFGHNDNFQVGVDGAKYADLSTAVQNAGGQTIYLRATNYAFEGASLNGDFTLDLGTHTLSLTSALTLSGTVTITDGTIEGGLVATGKLTLQGVTIVVDSAVLTVQGSGKVDVDEDCKFLASAGADTNTGKIVLDGSGVSGQFASAIENYNVSVTNNTCDQLTAKVTFGGQGISHSYSEKQCVYCGEAEPAPTVTKKTFTINFETFYDSIGQSSTDMSSGKITLGDYTYNCNNIYQGAQSLSGGLKEYYLILNDQGAYFANLTEWEGAITKITATVRSGATGKASYSLQLSSKVMSSALDDSAGENKVVYPGGGEHDIIVEVEQSLNLRFFNITQTVSTRKGQITKIVIEYYA